MIQNSLIYKKTIKEIAREIPISNKSFLVTGANGMIGSCLVDVLLEANQSFGKHLTIYAMGRSKEKLVMRFGYSSGICFVVQDVNDQIGLENIDYIIHTASKADPQSYAQYPVETMITNVMGTRNVLEYCKNKKTRALLTSSFEIYGKSTQTEFSEDDYGMIDLNRIRSCYPVSKMAAEILFKAYNDEYNVNCVIARLPSVYGPTMQIEDSKAHAQFIKNAIAGKDIVLKSKGEQKRTYCYVMDAVSGLLAILFSGNAGEAYNVSSWRNTASIAEIANTVAAISGQKVVYENPNEIEKKGFSKPQDCILNPEKIASLGWTAKYDIQSGLTETIRILQEMQ